MQCRSEAEEAGYRHLLAFIHSMGKEMPEGTTSVSTTSMRPCWPLVAACLLTGTSKTPPALLQAWRI